MVRLADLEPWEREHILAKAVPAYDTTPWVEGPTMEPAYVDGAEPSAVWAGYNVVESRGGWIRLVEPDSLGGRSRIIGPGRALVATGEGRYIAALVPRPRSRPGESPVRLVVYRTPR